MTKIAFFDVDGTMINVPHQLLKPTDKTIHALKEFQKQGNYIVVASARGVKPECLDEIPFDGFIGCDGGYIEFHQEILLNNVSRPPTSFITQIIAKHPKHLSHTLIHTV